MTSSADLAAFLATVRAWCRQEVEPREAAIDAGEFFPDLLEGAAELGLQGMLFTDTNGVDLEHLDAASGATSVIAEYSPAVALGVAIARLHGYLIARYAHAEVAAKWVPELASGTVRGSFAISEPDAGTDVRAVRTVAVEDGDGYRIRGQKAWITQAPEASFSIVLAKLQSSDRDAPTGAFVVPLDADGVTVGPPEDLAGFRGMPTGGLSFEDVWVPRTAKLDGDGFAIMMDGVNLSRLDAASYAIGMMDAALRRASQYANARVQFDQPIAEFQAIQIKLGHLATDLEAARSLLQRAERSFASDVRPDHILIAQAKLFASDAAMRHAVEFVQVFGANGLHPEYGAERMMRDAKVTQIFDGTSEVLVTSIGRAAARTEGVSD